MSEYDSSIRRQLADERAVHLAEEYRRAQRASVVRRRVAVADRIASIAAVARRRRAAHDPAYRH